MQWSENANCYCIPSLKIQLKLMQWSENANCYCIPSLLLLGPVLHYTVCV